ncbi:MAG: shikimate kinase [Oscillospiraceae bacterium]|nr:shikimate kinase [Oscillospiraceae bacterium]
MTEFKTPYGLIGRKLGHSISPEIHAALGNPHYSLYELEPEEMPEFLADTRLKALNVTIPYKIAVIPLCARLDPLAEIIGSVNTLVRQPDNTWKGYNTDAYGLRCMMRAGGLTFEGAHVLLLGNGGVSQTIQAVAKLDGCASLSVLDLQGAEFTYNDMPKFYERTTLLVNATPVGMYPNAGKSLADLRNFPNLRGVADVIYNPARTALLLQAEELGIPYAGGLTMLVAQAKQAAEYFFGNPVDDVKIAEIGADMQRDAENIVLIGMPGCGKSTIGNALEKLTGRPQVDLDAEIVKKAGKPIPEIFAAGGEDAFRKIESEVVREQSAQRGVILVTGGGVVTRAENYAPLRSNGRIYQICRPIEKLSREGRPLSIGADLNEMAAVRMPLYQKFADAKIENDRTPEAAAAEIWRDYCAYTRAEWTEFEHAGNS